MNLAIVKLDGNRIGALDMEPQGIGAIAWFHKNKPGCSMAHAMEHEGYSLEEIEEIDCHDVAPLIEAICARVGVTMETRFVPFSQSRNALGEWKCLNWKCVFKKHGRVILETDYSQGTASCPADKMKLHGFGEKGNRYEKRVRNKAIDREIETGRETRQQWNGSETFFSGKPIAGPRLGDVMHSLARDSDVLESGGFAEWASDLGYDDDSIKAKGIFDACMDHSLKLKGALGHALAEIRLVSQFN